jgi:hypothetical protein
MTCDSRQWKYHVVLVFTFTRSSRARGIGPYFPYLEAEAHVTSAIGNARPTAVTLSTRDHCGSIALYYDLSTTALHTEDTSAA